MHVRGVYVHVNAGGGGPPESCLMLWSQLRIAMDAGESNSGPQQKQQVLPTAEPCPAAPQVLL